MKTILYIILITLVLGMLLASAYERLDPVKDFVKEAFSSIQLLTTVSPTPSIPVKIVNGNDPYGYPVVTVSKAEIRELFFNKDFTKLNTLLDEYQKEVETDITKEFKLYDAYEVFGINDPSVLNLFEIWLKAYPGTYQPYLARAAYFHKMGWESRGYKWAKETKAEQFAQMGDYFKQCEQDLEKALQLNPNALHAYILLIRMNTALSNDDKIEYLVQKALNIYPNSFMIRVHYIHDLKPRWGGSYYEMNRLAAEAQSLDKLNPRLRLFQGFALADQANLAYLDDKYQKSIRLYSEALKIGEYWEFYQGRAYSYYYSKHYEAALADINNAILLRPQLEDSYMLRARISSELGNIDGAISDIESAKIIAPENSEINECQEIISDKLIYKAYQYFKGKKYPQAISHYNLAVKFNPEYPEAYYWRGQAYAYNQQYKLAFVDFEKTIALDPEYFDSYLAIDWLLAREGKWERIIGYWDKYLTLKPNDGRAFLERGGTNYHKGDMEAAARDAKKACELGNNEGCKRYKQFTGGK